MTVLSESAGARAAQGTHEILIDGVLYDCTHFKHPGGSVIRYFVGSGDATEIFTEFHAKLPKAHKILRRLPSRPAPPVPSKNTAEKTRLQKLSDDFARLRSQCVAEGLFNPCYLHLTYRLLELLLLHLLGVSLLFYSLSLWPVALFILGVAEGRCGWLMHEAGHYSATGVSWLDVKLQEVLYGFGDGMSASWWRVQHNKHHATPQKLRYDVDLETLPLVAFNEAIAKRCGNNAMLHRWLSLQKYLFAPVTCSLVALYWQLYLHPRHMYRTRRYTEGLSYFLRWCVVGAICHGLGVTFWQGLGGVLFSQLFGAAYIFVNFALSHTHLDVLPSDEHVHHVEYASIYTMNVAPNWFVNWFMGYLNFQIEHHLFPSMPQFRFAQLSKRVRQLFEENDLTYDSRPYFESLATTFHNLGEVANTMK